MIDFKLYLISDRTQCSPMSLEEAVAEACEAGIRAVQLREKDLSGKALYEEALRLRDVTRRTGTQLFINDRADIAIASGADGIHCPEEGLPISAALRLYPDTLVGSSVHSLERAKEAQMQGADFLLFGPIFQTPSKASYGDPLGREALAAVSENTHVPVFAVGGITPERAKDCLENGAAGVAVISAIMSAPDISKAVGEFERALGGL